MYSSEQGAPLLLRMLQIDHDHVTLQGQSPRDVPETVLQSEAVLICFWLSQFHGTDSEREIFSLKC